VRIPEISNRWSTFSSSNNTSSCCREKTSVSIADPYDMYSYIVAVLMYVLTV